MKFNVFKFKPWNMVSTGIHYLHIRQRVYYEFAEYPNKNKWIRFIDNLSFCTMDGGLQKPKLMLKKSSNGRSIHYTVGGLIPGVKNDALLSPGRVG